MTDKELKKLKRAELLQLLLTQSREMDRLKSELEEANKKLSDRNLQNEKAGSFAEACVGAYNIIEETQQAADLYLENVRRRAEELLTSLTPENAQQTLEALKEDIPAYKAAEKAVAVRNVSPADGASLETISLEDLFDEDDDGDEDIPDESSPADKRGVLV